MVIQLEVRRIFQVREETPGPEISVYSSLRSCPGKQGHQDDRGCASMFCFCFLWLVFLCRSGKFIGIDTSVWDSGACWGWELAVPEGVIAESGSESHLPPSRDLCARYFRLSLEPTIRSRLPSLPFHPLEPSHGGKLGHPGGTLFSIYRQSILYSSGMKRFIDLKFP